MTLLIYMLVLYFESRRFKPSTIYTSTALMFYPCVLGRWLKIPVIALLTLYVTAPFCASSLGGVAVSQIRRSKGRLYGMGLALASGLFYPLLALDAVMTVAIWYPVAGIAE